MCLRKVDPERIWELFDAEGVTHYSGAPTIHISIVNHDGAHPLEQRVTVADRRLAALADAARRRCASSTCTRSTSTG